MASTIFLRRSMILRQRKKKRILVSLIRGCPYFLCLWFIGNGHLFPFDFRSIFRPFDHRRINRFVHYQLIAFAGVLHYAFEQWNVAEQQEQEKDRMCRRTLRWLTKFRTNLFIDGTAAAAAADARSLISAHYNLFQLNPLSKYDDCLSPFFHFETFKNIFLSLWQQRERERECGWWWWKKNYI